MRRRRGEKVLRPVRPSAAIESAYKRRIEALVDEMARSYYRWLRATYRANPPEMAADATPARELDRELKLLGRRWRRRFDSAAPKMAAYFATSVEKRSDAVMAKILRDSGISVRMQMTPAMRDIAQATVAENVSLIKSIPAHFHLEVEGLVMRSVTVGRDLSDLTKELQHRFGVTRRRAELISRDQNSKATSAFTRARQRENGIDEAIWLHSHAGKTVRKTHLANNGKRFSVSRGWLDPDLKVQRRIFPGELINCFPGDVAVGLETCPTKLWRASFDGKMIYIYVGSDLLKGTPNHPVLTARGWIALGELNCGDQIVCMKSNLRKMVDDHKNNRKPTFSELFEASRINGINLRRDRGSFDFYGDVIHSQIDEIIIIDNNLSFDGESCLLKDLGNLPFSKSDSMASLEFLSSNHHISTTNLPSFGNDFLSLFERSRRKSGNGSNVARSYYNASFDEQIPDVSCRMTRRSEFFGDSYGTHSVPIQIDDCRQERDPVSAPINFNAGTPELFAELVRIAADRQCRVFQFGSVFYEFRSVSDKSVRDFSGHVFTMETRAGYYSAGNASVQAKNCRCVSKAIIKGFS